MTSIKKAINANAIWISDTHLGSKGSQIEKFEDFLKSISCKKLFLNGDIIDKFLIKNSTDLQTICKPIIDQIKQLQEEGTKIYFLQGNHDKEEDVKKVFLNIVYETEIKYKTLKNKTYLIFHGDKCDSSGALKTNFITLLGTKVYEFILSFKKKANNNKLNLSKIIKVVSKKIILILFQYEKQLLKYLQKENVDGVICGHSHQPIIKRIRNKDYLNCGDWVHHCSYIIETNDGTFKLLNY